ncbi:MAG: FAD:protein FMN transferase [Candidatus Omnitrophica bacterium]|nr:FAD:protein FMN transferase [Candidatus Omnitrophota bacterium]
MRKYGIKVLLGFLIGFAIGWFFWSQSRPLVKYRETNEIGDITVSIDVCVPQGEDTRKIARILDDVWQLKREILTRMSPLATQSDLSKVNSSYKNPQKISEDTYRILQQAIRFKDITRGAFDIGGGNLVELWKRCERQNRLPSEQEILEAKSASRTSSLKFLLGNRVEIVHPAMRIDLGGIASGYAVDQAVKLLQKKGVRNFLIDADGDMYASGQNCSRKPWTIAIRNPTDRSKIVDVIQVSNMSVSTSGGLESGYTIAGQRLSHIINPLTGVPQKQVASATVIAPTTFENDALARAVCVLNPKQGPSLIDSLGGQYACIIISKEKNGNLVFHKSRNYAFYQIKNLKR